MKNKLQYYLDELGINQTEFARFAGTTTRSVHRWKDKMPLYVEKLLKAWQQMNRYGIDWKNGND